MGFRFRKSIKIMPGLRVNIGKNGVTSYSVGGKGATINISKKGVRKTFSLPGTGVSYSEYTPHKSSANYVHQNEINPSDCPICLVISIISVVIAVVGLAIHSVLLSTLAIMSFFASILFMDVENNDNKQKELESINRKIADLEKKQDEIRDDTFRRGNLTYVEFDRENKLLIEEISEYKAQRHILECEMKNKKYSMEHKEENNIADKDTTPEIEPKFIRVNCIECNALIFKETADKTDAICMSCFNNKSAKKEIEKQQLDGTKQQASEAIKSRREQFKAKILKEQEEYKSRNL